MKCKYLIGGKPLMRSHRTKAWLARGEAPAKELDL
jgi:hypothetical protein